jgi:hypothetical protein
MLIIFRTKKDKSPPLATLDLSKEKQFENKFKVEEGERGRGLGYRV